ncbi:MAG TPA: agmatinase [Planctomycetota bacterium]|nr:agmatinase [Planctomycetota bacterium]HRU52434.1 agmatinase [Planctomycetota bacterium]
MISQCNECWQPTCLQQTIQPCPNSCILGFDKPYEQAKLVVFGAPFDGTTSYRPGARFGPSSIRAESFGMETYSPYCKADLQDIQAHDAGDIELPFGDTQTVLSYIYAYTKQILADNKIPCMLGGEHLVTLPAVTAVYEKYSDLHLIHLDAHADLREDYLGMPLSHASVIRRIWEKLGDYKIWQFGIRSGERIEFEWASQHTHFHPLTLDVQAVQKMVVALQEKPIYLTIDLDILDPSIFPGTGTPEHGGITYRELIQFFQIIQPLCIVGADLVELSPHYDPSGRSTAAACTLLRELSLHFR